MPNPLQNRIEELALELPKHPNEIWNELIEKTGKSRETIWKYRRNEVMMGADTAIVIADYFGVSVENLFGLKLPK